MRRRQGRKEEREEARVKIIIIIGAIAAACILALLVDRWVDKGHFTGRDDERLEPPR
jgi:hypothetical protein